jgi:hypothetical protein
MQRFLTSANITRVMQSPSATQLRRREGIEPPQAGHLIDNVTNNQHRSSLEGKV